MNIEGIQSRSPFYFDSFRPTDVHIIIMIFVHFVYFHLMKQSSNVIFGRNHGHHEYIFWKCMRVVIAYNSDGSPYIILIKNLTLGNHREKDDDFCSMSTFFLTNVAHKIILAYVVTSVEN